MSFQQGESKSSSTAGAELCSAGRTRASVPTWFVRLTRLLLPILREIFDESAYSRFLSRQGMSSSPSAYATFLREQEGVKARRPKCC
jgi:hypothetical protein